MYQCLDLDITKKGSMVECGVPHIDWMSAEFFLNHRQHTKTKAVARAFARWNDLT